MYSMRTCEYDNMYIIRYRSTCFIVAIKCTVKIVAIHFWYAHDGIML